MSSAKKLIEFWARCRFYEPFTMGGDVWRWVKYKLEGTQRIAAGYKVYTVDHGGLWTVYEARTGGAMCSAKTEKAVLQKVRRLLKITPDFDEQVAAHRPLEGMCEVPTEEAIDRLKKTENAEREKEKA